METGSGKRRSLWTASSRKTGPKWVWKRLVELSTMSLGTPQEMLGECAESMRSILLIIKQK